MPPSSSRSKKTKVILTDVHRRFYAQEKETNFRWIYKLFASRCPEPLPPSSLADVALEYELATIGKFAEVAHGSVSPTFVWANLETLLKPTYPLEGCTELEGSRLLKAFIGSVARLQAYIAHRPEQKQIVVAFSGTSDVRQALHDLNALPKRFPHDRRKSNPHQAPKVHRGFWKMYTGVRTKALEGLGEALQQLGGEVSEVIITGHSLGGAMASFFLLDLLQLRDADCPSWWPPHELTWTLATFGSPRIGNMAFSESYQLATDAYRSRHGQDRLREYAVRAFNDGVPCLPFTSFGYVHLPQTILYLYNGRIYHVPGPMRDYAEFDIDDENAPPPRFPLGGHNYYNNRDMERILRELRWIDMHSEQSWEEHYRSRIRTDME